jgi:hypothetical protein
MTGFREFWRSLQALPGLISGDAFKGFQGVLAQYARARARLGVWT